MSLLLWLAVLVQPILFAVSNILDKRMVHGEEDDSNSLSLIAIGSLFILPLVIILGLFCTMTGRIPGAEVFVPLFFNGMSFTLYVWLFYQALKKEEASRVVPWFQIIPAFGFVGGILMLNEDMSWYAILAIILLMAGGFVLSVVKGKVNWKVIAMMVLASALCAWNDLVLAKYGRELLVSPGSSLTNILESTKDIAPALFADLLGKLFFGTIFLVCRTERRGFVLGVKTKFKLVFSSNVAFTLGSFVFDCAKIFAPVAIVQALCCTQPLFVLIGAVVLTIFHKSFLAEEISGKTLVQKIVGVGLMVVGGILLSI